MISGYQHCIVDFALHRQQVFLVQCHPRKGEHGRQGRGRKLNNSTVFLRVLEADGAETSNYFTKVVLKLIILQSQLYDLSTINFRSNTKCSMRSMRTYLPFYFLDFPISSTLCTLAALIKCLSFFVHVSICYTFC